MGLTEDPSLTPGFFKIYRQLRCVAMTGISKGNSGEKGFSRILEIGFTPLMVTNPNFETTYIETQVKALPGEGKLGAAFAQARRLVSAALDNRHELVVCRSFSRFIWRSNMSAMANLMRYFIYWLIRVCVGLRVRAGAMLVVLDWDDEDVLFARDLFLLDACTLYFKRELPQNFWNAFKYIQPPHQEPITDFTSNPQFLPRMAKLRPVPLGISTEKIERIDQALQTFSSQEKSMDVFFAGRLTSSTVRAQGLAELKSLTQAGFKIDISEGKLPFDEFVRRMSQAWLVWSPEGGGWDCWRHSEIALAGSVPLINYPTIRRHAPLLDGIHSIFYNVDEGGIARAVQDALLDRLRLQAMAVAARIHVLKHHSYPRIADYIVRSAREAE